MTDYHGNAGQQVSLIVTMETLVSRYQRLLPMKRWSTGFTDRCHGNPGQQVLLIVTMEIWLLFQSLPGGRVVNLH